MSWWEWMILIIGAVGIIILLLFPMDKGSKITIAISMVTAIVTIYNLVVDIGIRTVAEKDTILSEDKAHWTDIHTMFLNHSSLDTLYRDIYQPISDTPDEYAALSILAQTIEGMIEVHGVPDSLTWHDILNNDWLRRIYTWVANDRFHTYWQRNSKLYKPYTDDVITTIWSLIPDDMM